MSEVLKAAQPECRYCGDTGIVQPGKWRNNTGKPCTHCDAGKPAAQPEADGVDVHMCVEAAGLSFGKRADCKHCVPAAQPVKPLSNIEQCSECKAFDPDAVCPQCKVTPWDEFVKVSQPMAIPADIQAAVLAEREACAKLCDEQHDRARTSTGAARADACADAIRSRSKVVCAALEKPFHDYQRANPLGGPAKVFDAMADAIRAGDDYHAVLRIYGYAEVPKHPTAWMVSEWSGTGMKQLTFDGPPETPSVRDEVVNPVWTPLYANAAPAVTPTASADVERDAAINEVMLALEEAIRNEILPLDVEIAFANYQDAIAKEQP